MLKVDTGGSKLPLVKPLRSPCYLNRAHPHAKGVVAAYLMNDSGSKAFDHAAKNCSLSLINTSWNGNGLKIDANGEYGNLDNTNNSIINSDQGTIIIKFRALSSILDGTLRYAYGKNGASWVDGDFALYKYIDGDIYFQFRSGATLRYLYIKPASLPTWQTGIQIATQWSRVDPAYSTQRLGINVNGNNITPTGGAYTATWNQYTIAPAFGVGNDIDNTNRPLNAVIEYMYFYNTVLSETKIKNIYKNPYAMFYQPNILNSVAGSFISGGVGQQSNYYGANAYPIGRGL